MEHVAEVGPFRVRKATGEKGPRALIERVVIVAARAGDVRVDEGVDYEERGRDEQQRQERQTQQVAFGRPLRPLRLERHNQGDDNRVGYCAFPTEILVDNEGGRKYEREPQTGVRCT